MTADQPGATGAETVAIRALWDAFEGDIGSSGTVRRQRYDAIEAAITALVTQRDRLAAEVARLYRVVDVALDLWTIHSVDNMTRVIEAVDVYMAEMDGYSDEDVHPPHFLPD